MGNETNEFGKSLGDSALSNSEEIFSKKLLEKGANLRFKGYSESFKLNPEIAFKNLQKGRIFQKVGNAFGKKILSQLNLFSNIKADYDKTKNIIYSTAKNVTRSCRHLFNPNKNRSKIDK